MGENLNAINYGKKRRLNIYKIFFFLFILVIISITAKASAENFNLINWYLNNKKITEEHSIINDVLRSISWVITSLLALIADSAESLYNAAFDFIDITTYRTVQLFIEDFKPILIGILAISLFALFLMIMLGHEKRPKMMQNFVILILVVSASTLCFNEMNSLVKTFKTAVDGYKVSDSSSLTYSAINSNLIDFVRLSSRKKGLDKVDFKHASKDTKASYFGAGIKDDNDFANIDYKATLNPDSSIYNYATEGNTKEILSNKLITRDIERKNYTTQKVDDGWGWNSDDDSDFGNEFYYRYYQNTLNTWLNLAAIIVLYLTMAYKVVRLSYEIVMSRILVTAYAGDFSSGERQKKILMLIRDTYIMFAVVILSIKLYQIVASYSNTHYTDLRQGIFTLFTAFIVIDGPNIVEKILGMDAGLKSSTARLLAAGSAAGFMFKKGKNFSKAAASGGKKMFKTGKKAFAGAKENAKKYKDKASEKDLKGKEGNITTPFTNDEKLNTKDNLASDNSSPNTTPGKEANLRGSTTHKNPSKPETSNKDSFKETSKTKPQTKTRNSFENSMKKQNKDSFNNQNRFSKNIKSKTDLKNQNKPERKNINDKTNRKHKNPRQI